MHNAYLGPWVRVEMFLGGCALVVGEKKHSASMAGVLICIFFLNKERPEGVGSFSLKANGGGTKCYKGPHKI
jgi:hypothetical protein